MNSIAADLGVRRRGDWGAQAPAHELERDWNYNAIVIHNSGHGHLDTMLKIQNFDLTTRHWDDISYHYGILPDGIIFEGRQLVYKGADVYKQNTGKVGVVCNEADVMQAYLVRAGVPADAVLVDRERVNTMTTALHAAAILRVRGLRSAMVVTQWFHVPRCILAMRRNGVGDVAATYPAFAERRDVYSFARELADLPRYALLPIARLAPQTP